jgi:outer membrane lipoprotein-sorting protein
MASLVGLGQTGTDAVELIRKIEAQRQHVVGVWQQGLMIKERKFEGMVKRSEEEFTVAFRRPNLLRREVRGDAPWLTVSDGTQLWELQERDRTYRKKPAPKGVGAGDHWIGQSIPLSVGEGDVLLLIPPSRIRPEEVVLLGQQELEINSGEKVLCYVLEAQTPYALSNYDFARMKVWVGTNDLMMRKIESIFVPKQPSPVREIKITVIITKLLLNESVPQSLFTFTPPLDAVEVPVKAR